MIPTDQISRKVIPDQMEDHQDYHYSFRDIANVIKSFLLYLIKKWWLLLLAVLVGGAIGGAFYIIQKPKYEGVCTFLLEDKQSSMGGLSSIASQFGFDFGGISGGSFFAGDNILDILRSKKIVTKVLLSKLDSSTHTLTLADLYLEFTGKREQWKKKALLSQINFSNKNLLSPLEDSVLNTIYEGVVKNNLTADRTSKKGTIIKVQVTSPNDDFARLMAQRLVEEASKLYLTIKTGTALANISRMQRRADSLLILLNNKSYSAAITQPLDANPGLKTSIVPSEIAMRDKSVITVLYTEVTKNLEASKLLLSQDTPMIQVLDTPGMLLDAHKKGLLYLIVISSLVAVVIIGLVSGLVFFVSKL